MKISPLQLALKSDALVKLHLSDLYDVVVDIPVKNLIKISDIEDTFTDSALYSNLHHCGLAALFKYVSDRHMPVHWWKNVKLVTYHNTREGAIQFSTDRELTEILEEAVTECLMDDNNGVILEVYCKFFKKNHSSCNEEVRKIRASATVAAEKVVIKLKIWVTRAQQLFEAKSTGSRKTLEYIFRPGSDESKQVEWPDRFAQFFRTENESSGKEFWKQTEVGIHSAETPMDILVAGAMISSELFSVGAEKVFNFISSTITKHHEKVNPSIPIPSPTPSLDSCSIIHSSSSRSIDTEEEEFEKGVEIIFDPKDDTAPSEWKIFFEDDASESGDLGTSEDGVMVELSDDVLSCSSSEKHSCGLEELSFTAVSNTSDDNESWDLLGGQE